MRLCLENVGHFSLRQGVQFQPPCLRQMQHRFGRLGMSGDVARYKTVETDLFD